MYLFWTFFGVVPFSRSCRNRVSNFVLEKATPNGKMSKFGYETIRGLLNLRVRAKFRGKQR